MSVRLSSDSRQYIRKKTGHIVNCILYAHSVRIPFYFLKTRICKILELIKSTFPEKWTHNDRWSRILFIHHRGVEIQRYNHLIFQENPSWAHSHWPDHFAAESDWRWARPRHVILDTILTIKYKTNVIYIGPIGPARTTHLHLRLLPSMVWVFWSTGSLRDTKPSNWSVRLWRNSKRKKNIKYRLSGIVRSSLYNMCVPLWPNVYLYASKSSGVK